MTENKRFWVENEKILNTYVIRIYKEDEIIFEINNWNSLNESNKVECEGIANELNKLSDENEELKSIKCFADRHGIDIFNIVEAFRKCWNDNAKLIKENEKLKNANVSLSDFRGFINVEHIRTKGENEDLKQQIKLLKLALCEELQDNGNAFFIRIFDDLFGLNYDEWESKHEYSDWEEILKNKKELAE